MVYFQKTAEICHANRKVHREKIWKAFGDKVSYRAGLQNWQSEKVRLPM
jgi:hypothetical protein